VPINMVAGRGLPFHCATVQGDKLFPFKVSAIAGPVCASVAAAVGEIELMTGVGRVVPLGKAFTENGSEFEVIVELETVIETVPGNAVSAGKIAAVSCVGLTYVVGRGVPFQFTTRPTGTKFVPVTVKVSPAGLQAVVVFAVVGDVEVDAERDVIVGGTIEKGI